MILLVICWIISLGVKNFQHVFTYKRSLLAWALLPVMHLTSKGTYLHVKPFAKVCSLNGGHLKPTMQCACTQHNNFVLWIAKFVQWVLTQGGQVLNPNTNNLVKLWQKGFYVHLTISQTHFERTHTWQLQFGSWRCRELIQPRSSQNIVALLQWVFQVRWPTLVGFAGISRSWRGHHPPE
jgi:hypothetical protein